MREKKTLHFTATVVWQNFVFVRMATILARKGFDVIGFKRLEKGDFFDLLISVEGQACHWPNTRLVLEQLIDVQDVRDPLGDETPVTQNTKDTAHEESSMKNKKVGFLQKCQATL